MCVWTANPSLENEYECVSALCRSRVSKSQKRFFFREGENTHAVHLVNWFVLRTISSLNKYAHSLAGKYDMRVLIIRAIKSLMCSCLLWNHFYVPVDDENYSIFHCARSFYFQFNFSFDIYKWNTGCRHFIWMIHMSNSSHTLSFNRALFKRRRNIQMKTNWHPFNSLIPFHHLHRQLNCDFFRTQFLWIRAREHTHTHSRNDSHTICNLWSLFVRIWN